MSVRKSGKFIIAIAAIGGLAIAAANAKDIGFSTPEYKGKLLDWCYTWATSCGKPAADAWCQFKGFDNSSSFHKWNNPGMPTRVIGTGQVCDQPDCDSFTDVVCHKDENKPPKVFDKPKYEGLRLDWCRAWATGCGKPAAQAYCVYKGFMKTTGWQIDANIGKTKIISTGQVCNDPTCDGFVFVACQ